ncbi:MAG: hypothetical protein EP329_27725 [Deltaproteobacteria bacterium]|nr:MAG: hypothetical protein EP329_27725 [Deltaproteobacteria bacterium]
MQRREFDVPEFGSAATRGICATCVQRDGCGWAAHSRTAIWQCGEFDPGPSATATRAPVPVATAPVHADALGLCVSCANAATCTLPGRTGGAWYCEEHR